MTSSSRSRWVAVSRGKQRPTCRLFCFPFAGGSASAFRPWARELPPQLELCAIQLPGREDRFNESLLRRLDAVVRGLVDALPPFLDLPYAFFGHSMGGVVVWEVARALQGRQRGPVRLFASGCVAPQRMSMREPIFQLPDAEFLQRLRSLNGIPKEAEHPELLSLVLPIFRADMEIYDTFRYAGGEPLHAPISVYLGDQDPTVPRAHAAEWAELSDAGFHLASFPGDHFFINSHRSGVIRALSAELGLAAAPAA